MIRVTNDIFSEKVLDKINEGLEKLFEGCKTDKEIATKFLKDGQATVRFYERNELGEIEGKDETVTLDKGDIRLTGYDFDAYDFRLNFIGEDYKTITKFSIEIYKCIYNSDEVEVSFSKYSRVEIFERVKG